METREISSDVSTKKLKTLKSRTTKMLYLAFFTSTIFFTIIILSTGLILFKNQLKTECEILSKSLATDINNKKMYTPQNGNMSSQADNKFYSKNKSSNTIKKHPIAPLNKTMDNNSLLRSRIYLSKEKQNLDKELATEKISYQKSPLNFLYNYFNISHCEPIKNSSGKIIAYASVRVNCTLLVNIIKILFLILFLTSILLLIIGKVISKLFAIPIITPINILEEKMRELASENYHANSYIPLSIKRPFKEINSMLQSTNLIIKKMNFYNDQLSQQKKDIENQFYELEAQNQELVESRSKIQLANEQLDISEKAVKNILNNVGQGFLTFDEDLLVNDEYSLECEKIFGFSIKNQSFNTLIFPSDDQQANFIRELSIKILNEVNIDKRKLYMPLLPNEVVINGKALQTEYKIIEDSRNSNHYSLMVIITDISEKKTLQGQIEKERNILKMVVKAVVNYNDFIETVDEYRNFYNSKLNNILSSNKKIDDILFEVFRNVHTFKGTFMQLDMINIVNHLHDMETEISSLTKQLPTITMDDIIKFLSTCQMSEWLDSDIKLLKEILGDEFFNQKNKIIIDIDKLTAIEKNMMNKLSPSDYMLLISELNRLHYKPFNEILKPHTDYSLNIANRMGKLLNPINITGGNFLADNKKYSDLMHSIVHIFRNMVDHGIELPEQRILNHKSEYGNIFCNIELANDNIILKISDDGKGIDIQSLKEKLVQKGIFTIDSLKALSYQEILNTIFLDGFSTKDRITEFSGRGVGLSAVKNEVDKLGGRIQVTSEVNVGTEFCIVIPFSKTNLDYNLPIAKFMDCLASETKKLLAEKNKLIDITALSNYKLLEVDKLHLKYSTSFMTLKGIFDGTFILSVDKEMANLIIDSLILDEISPEERCNLIEDSVAEFSNIILGNSLKNFPEIEELLKVDPPVTISSKSASINYPSSKVWNHNVSYDIGSLSLSFVSPANI